MFARRARRRRRARRARGAAHRAARGARQGDRRQPAAQALAVACDVAQEADIDAPRRRDRRALRPRRRAREQRGLQPGASRPRSSRGRRLARAARREPDRRLPLRAALRPRMLEARARDDRERRLGPRPRRRAVRSRQAAYAAAKGGVVNLTRELAAAVGAPRRARERARAGLVPDRDDGRHVRRRGLAEVDAQPHADGPRGRARRARRPAPLPRLRRLELRDRPDLAVDGGWTIV